MERDSREGAGAESGIVRFDMVRGPPVDFGKLPPAVTVEGYPPLKDEGSRDYINRVQAQIMGEIYAPKPSIAERFRARLSRCGGPKASPNLSLVSQESRDHGE